MNRARRRKLARRDRRRLTGRAAFKRNVEMVRAAMKPPPFVWGGSVTGRTSSARPNIANIPRLPRASAPRLTIFDNESQEGGYSLRRAMRELRDLINNFGVIKP